MKLRSIESNKTSLKRATLKYGSKLRKVSRCRPAVSNETILATRHEFFFSFSWHCVIAWLMLLSWMFISSYTTIYFSVKKFIFSNGYITVNAIFESRSLILKLLFSHTISCWNRSHKIVGKQNTRLSPETERTTCITNCRTSEGWGD